MPLPKPDRILNVQCPVCNGIILWNIDNDSDHVKCSACNSVVEVPASAKADAEQFKALSDAFMRK